jgi:hypothetical protein
VDGPSASDFLPLYLMPRVQLITIIILETGH